MDEYAQEELNIRLVDLIEIPMLQQIQNSVAKMGRMATIISDIDGVPITEGSNFSRLCRDFCRKSPEGRKRCENCDKMGAIMAFEQKKPTYYYCHAGLIDFSAPILLNGRMIGIFSGGQLLADKPDMEAMKKVAREIGVDEEEFLVAASEINIVPMAAIDRLTNFVYDYAKLLSDMAEKAYVAMQKSDEALRAAAAKTDFLANMSHEIRTPMNAIIGMSQIALREDMSPEAKKCVEQIASSGKMLLSIINDVLDYSKIDAGKMKITKCPYSPLKLIDELTNILINRVGDKNLEVIIDVNPSIPSELMGDDIRIKQIILNLANNAVKFTKAGQVVVRLDYKRLDSENIMLYCAVEDTGIGIKKEDMPKLFNSFEQVDSKRNREIEGTGLGLAIVNQLVTLMGGKINVESEYEKGSIFSFEIPQKIVNGASSVEFLSDCKSVLGIIRNPYVRKQLQKDMSVIGAQYLDVGESEDLVEKIQQMEAEFLFVEDFLSENLIESVTQIPGLNLVVLSAPNAPRHKEIPGAMYIEKPVSIMKLESILSHRNLDIRTSEKKEDILDFQAPEAKVLIVDDNEVNLTVAAGLLEPLCMKVQTAKSGMEAIELISGNRYDIVFMDHMMPEMDGIETTRMIRKYHPEYKDVPVIALTANAISGNREMFLKEGMNDFVPKPIEFKEILAVIRRWLPKEKIQAFDPDRIEKKNPTPEQTTDSNSIKSLTFLDTQYAVGLLGTEKLFWTVLKDYWNMIEKKANKIKTSEETEEIGTYIVEVHALKSSSKQIGAMSLSKKAERLEAAGNRHDFALIHEMTDEMLAEYRHLHEVLKPYFGDKSGNDTVTKQSISSDEIKGYLMELRNAFEELDFDVAEEILAELQKYHFDEEGLKRLAGLQEVVQEMDVECCEQIIDEWEQKIL